MENISWSFKLTDYLSYIIYFALLWNSAIGDVGTHTDTKELSEGKVSLRIDGSRMLVSYFT